MRKLFLKDFNIMRMIVASTILLFAMFTIVLMFIGPVSAASSPIVNPSSNLGEFNGDYVWDTVLAPPASASDYITYSNYRTNYCLAATTAANCIAAASGKYIRIDTAEELYHFSMDVSYEDIYISGNPTEDVKLSHEKIAALLSLNYKLGGNIDYSVMAAQTFVPIGYYFTDADPINPSSYDNVFTGTFDGQGFTISNLYVAGYDYMVTEQVLSGNTIYVATSAYYSMFNYNEGTIRNVGLINPTLEMQIVHLDINFTANLVGLNDSTGVVDHVYVIDNRTNVLSAGIRYNVGTTSDEFTAAGIVHTNKGSLTNAYYSSKIVVNGSYINKFIVQPVLYSNVGGTYSQLVYDSTVYLLSVTVGTSTYTIATPNAYAPGETTTVLKSTSSTLNDADDLWHFYASDTYPILNGLDYDDVNDVYEINNAIDFVFFAKVIAYVTVHNGVSYANADYVLTDHIDMSEVAAGIYTIPTVNFNGSLSGLNPLGTTLADNYYIYNLNITTGIIRSSIYYAGLFSILGASAHIHDINIDSSSIALTDTETYYSNVFNVGFITGRNSGGTIENIQTDVSINLGTAAIGETHVGGIAGISSGTVKKISVLGSMNAGSHTFSSAYTIVPRYYIGGVIGSATGNQLKLNEVINSGSITGFSTLSTPSFSSGYTNIEVKVGGVIGYILNTSTVIHQMVNVTNTSDITVGQVIDNSTPDPIQNVGGVFGELTGYAPILESGGLYLFANLYNSGDILYTYSATRAEIRSAGIGINNATQNIEYALLSNHGSFVLSNAPTTSTNTAFRYTGTIFDVGSNSIAITLSRVYNHSNLYFDSTYYTNISPLYFSINNSPTLIRYSANYGHVYFMKTGGTTQITIYNSLVISGISSSTNISYANVENFGNIYAVNLNIQNYSLFVSGFSKELSINKYLKNSINNGSIIVAKILSQSAKWTAPPANSGFRNIYIGGFVNINRAGDLQDIPIDDDAPTALEGIINCINYGAISTSYGAEVDALYGILGMANTFVGGIATLNAGSIQDSANLSKISAANLSSPTLGYASQNQNYSYSNTMGTSYTLVTNVGYNSIYTDAYQAGRMVYVNAGIVAGGIVGVTVSGTARVYDTANNGDIFGASYSFARIGGVLGECLYEEVVALGITTDLGVTNALGTYISSSVLSNGMNFGNISAITNIKSVYSTTAQSVYATSNTNYQNMMWFYRPGSTTRIYSWNNGLGTGYTMSIYEDTTRASEERPAVFGSAGGVIAYGLAVMRRMLNHGAISGTDVAGGIIGATYVIGGSSSGTVTTFINIHTAINYGDVDAIPVSSYTNVNLYSMSYANISAQFMTGATRTSYLFPVEAVLMRKEPANKPGFGGIIGRLQRGSNGEMEPVDSESFKFIVNANPDIDLIGRIDQVFNYTASSTAYIFRSAKGNYYSARQNDTTQVVFTGYYYARASVTARTLVSGYKYRYTLDVTNYYEIIGKTAVEITNPGPDPIVDFIAGTYAYQRTPTTGTVLFLYVAPIQVPWITEDPDATLNDATEWIYDELFPMRDDDNLTEYIYYMPNELLADKFALEEYPVGVTNPSYREYGMYVLSTTAGASVGLVLPSNIELLDMRSIDETSTTAPSLLIDYENVGSDFLNDIDADLETSFNNLKQTKFNEKSLLIQDDIQYINLEEINGSNSTLVNGVIDNDLKTVTFSISMEAFSTSYSTATYRVSQALSSAKSLIAVRTVDYYNTALPPTVGQLHAINDLLYAERNDGISTDYAPELTVTLPARDVTTVKSIGFLTVYSEAFVGDYEYDLYANANYYTDYEIIVNFTPALVAGTGPVISTVNFNGGANVNVTNQTDVRSLGNVNYNGSINFNFTDDYDIFSVGFDFKDLMTLQFNGVTVDPMYYSITSTPATIIADTGYYSVLISFLSGTLKSGDYTLLYRYFESSSQNSVIFDKAASNQTALSGLAYYSSNGSVSIVGSVVSSSVNFGYPLNITTSFSTATNTGLAEYLSRVTYNPAYMTSGSFQISPFSTLTSVTVGTPTYNVNGYRVYTVTYRITAENGSTYVDYVHTITERTIDLTSVLKNDNEVTLDQVDAAREDALTTFTLDLSLDQTLDLYDMTVGNYPYISVNATSLLQPIQGITYGVGDYLYIYMDYTTLPDTYTFTFTIHQTASVSVTLSTTLDIVKLEGTDSYLKDIKFSELLTGTVYPDISITDEDGVDISTAYDPRVYFGGVDYDGSEGFYYFYRVDGKVSNTPFDQYVPYMVDYLPYGATIARGTWNTLTLDWDYGTEVGTGDDITPLIANFSIDPKTGSEGEAMIPYRVTSEDGMTSTVYYITVTDVTYNVTLIFDIYYCTGELESTCSLASTTEEFASTLFIITVKNYAVSNNSVMLTVQPDNANTNPALFPVFDEIINLNNQMAQFNFTNTINHKYSFGRNMSGFYMFDISLPLDEYLNSLYTYEIKHDVYYLDDASDFVTGLNGKYYYVGYAEQNRTKRFNIYIRSVTPSTDVPWGLYDFFRSWFDN